MPTPTRKTHPIPTPRAGTPHPRCCELGTQDLETGRYGFIKDKGMGMKKILYFDWFGAATEWYRMLPLVYLKSDQFTINRSTEKEVTFATIEEYDVIIVSRPSNVHGLNLIQLAKDQKKYVICDFDDDCLHLPRTNPMYQTYEDGKKDTIASIVLSDEVWVATEAIKKSFRLYNKNIHVIPNAWNDTVFPVNMKKPFSFSKIAMWRGGHSHKGDIYKKGVTEYVLSLINGNPNWKWYWMGQKFDFIEERLEHPNYFYHDGASTVQFYKLMQDYHPTIFYYPLETNIFNRGKSNCSLLESVFSGAAYFGNTELPEMQKPGVMDFSELSGVLKMSDKKMESLLRINHEKSWNYIQEHLLLSKVNEKRLERLCRL